MNEAQKIMTPKENQHPPLSSLQRERGEEAEAPSGRSPDAAEVSNASRTGDTWFVFDVESIGLHGEGYVVVSAKGEHDARRFACPPENTEGVEPDRKWVAENIPPIPVTHDSPREVRNAFWTRWDWWKRHGAKMASDCGWPVEARFLNQCVDDDRSNRKWNGPYPLNELSSVLLARGLDPIGTFNRIESEIPKHDPLCDARQSARILMEQLAKSVSLTSSQDSLVHAGGVVAEGEAAYKAEIKSHQRTEKLRQELSRENQELRERLTAIKNIILRRLIGSCACGTKTNDVKYHRTDCPYRIYHEIEYAARSAQKEEKPS